MALQNERSPAGSGASVVDDVLATKPNSTSDSQRRNQLQARRAAREDGPCRRRVHPRELAMARSSDRATSPGADGQPR